VEVFQETESTQDIVSLLREAALFLWKDWPRDMRLSSINQENTRFVLNGECPHCGVQAAFPTVSATFKEMESNWPTRIIGAARCIACNEYILGILAKDSHDCWIYQIHFPLGKPNDDVADEIPDTIKSDLKEAMRCLWVRAYNATAEMCRRALESSCIELGAEPDVVLSEMIDWVHAQGKITNSLRDMAHKIKLGGNRAAHPSDRILSEEDANAVVDFTLEYFQHVYVTPARMARHNFDKPAKKGKP
jgi:hypothetical protein